MIIFLYGADAEKRNKKLKWMIAEYEKKHSAFSAQHFDFAEEGAFFRFKDGLSAHSLFDSCRLAVVRDIFPAPKGMEAEYVSALRSLLEKKEVVALIASSHPPTKEFSFLLRKPVMTYEFPLVGGGEARSNFFDDIRRIKNASPQIAALPIAEKLLESEDPAYIFNMFAALAYGEEKKIFADYDVAVKSGALDYEMAITDYILSRG